MTTRKKSGHNMKDVAKLRHEDLEAELHLQNMQLKAQKDPKPSKPLSNQSRTSKVDEKYLSKDNLENDIRAKLGRIGYNSRVTPDDLVQKKVLSRPEQTEIDASNMRIRELGKDANANLANEVPPTLEFLPKTEQDWVDIDEDRYALEQLQQEKLFYENEIEKATIQMDRLKHQGIHQGITEQHLKKAHDRNKDAFDKTQKATVTAIAALERDMRNYTTALRRVTAQIRNVKELRQMYIAEQKQQYKVDMDAYVQQISALTSAGLSTQRLVKESDEDYAARMYDNVQSITTQEQLYAGQLYLIREFISKLLERSIGSGGKCK